MSYWISKDGINLYVVMMSGYEHHVLTTDVFGTKYYRFAGNIMHLPWPELLLPGEIKPWAQLLKEAV